MRKSNEIDMTFGGTVDKLLLFAIPFMLSGMLQLLYNAADIIVVGKFAGEQCLAAVGATGALNNLIVNLFIGLSVGCSVVVARAYGSKDIKSFSDAMHTSVLLGIISGLIACIVGQVILEPLLHIMRFPADIINLSEKYMRIIFLGLPAQMLYNFGSAVLRATGDTRKPLYILAISGLLNVSLNLLLVIVFKMDVDGVAIATISAQYVSATSIVISLHRLKTLPKLEKSKLKIHKSYLLTILKIGIPSGINGCLFSLSNSVIQSAINTYGTIVVAGNSVGSNIEGFVWTGMNSFHHATLTYVSQNYGAQKFERISRGILYGLLCVTVTGIVLGGGAYLLGEPLSAIYNSNPAVINAAITRMSYISVTYFLCGIMDVINGALRGLGHSTTPMLINILCVCVLRLIFTLYIFPYFEGTTLGLSLVYISWPVSWVLSLIFQLALLIYCIKKINKAKA